MSQAGGSNQAHGNTRKRARAIDDDDGRSTTLSTEGTHEPQDNSMGEIHVGTGEGKKVWRVHIKRFANMSPWLREAFARAAVENQELPKVMLPYESPRVFAWVHDWIYAVSFSGLRSAPVPVINDAGSHGLTLAKESSEDPGQSDADDDVVITGVRVKVENEAKPLAGPAPEESPVLTAPAPAPATADDAKPPAVDNDELQEVAADRITPRDLMDLYILGLKLHIYSLRNAALDALHVWFHPDAQEKEKPRRRNRGRTTNPYAPAAPAAALAAQGDGDNGDNDNDDVEDYEPAKRLPFRRVPWMTDVQHVFASTPEDNPLRRFLICTSAIFLFSKRPQGKELPEEWKAVLTGTGEIGFCLLQFIARCRWVAGSKTEPKGKLEVLRVWAKHAFHEAETNISLN